MKAHELRKQITLSLPLSDWKAIRFEAARRGIAMTELCRQWIRPGLERVRTTSRAEPTATDVEEPKP